MRHWVKINSVFETEREKNKMGYYELGVNEKLKISESKGRCTKKEDGCEKKWKEKNKEWKRVNHGKNWEERKRKWGENMEHEIKNVKKKETRRK